MFNDLRPVVLNAICESPPAGLIDSMLVGTRNGDATQCDARQRPLLPFHGPPIHESHDAGEGVISVMVEEELLEDIKRAIESERLRTGPVLLDVRRAHALHG